MMQLREKWEPDRLGWKKLLYKRIVEGGTLTEAGGVPDPLFALASTINWMRALALLADHNKINFQSAQAFYSGVTTHKFIGEAENTIFEQLFFALHQLSALEAFRGVPRKADVSRMGIVTWYYGLYNAASAMITAQTGGFQDNHLSTANAWDSFFPGKGMALEPFALRVTTLVQRDCKAEIAVLRAGNLHDLKRTAFGASDANGACCAYLAGSANYYRWRAEEELKKSKDFKALGKADFRTKDAQRLRDQRLARRSVSFLHQAFRYRGKANYREALFLGYGPSIETLLSSYVDDLAAVLQSFVTMAGAFASRRLGQQLWADFLTDVDKNRAFTVGSSQVWR